MDGKEGYGGLSQLCTVLVQHICTHMEAPMVYYRDFFKTWRRYVGVIYIIL